MAVGGEVCCDAMPEPDMHASEDRYSAGLPASRAKETGRLSPTRTAATWAASCASAETRARRGSHLDALAASVRASAKEDGRSSGSAAENQRRRPARDARPPTVMLPSRTAAREASVSVRLSSVMDTVCTQRS